MLPMIPPRGRSVLGTALFLLMLAAGAVPAQDLSDSGPYGDPGLGAGDILGLENPYGDDFAEGEDIPFPDIFSDHVASDVGAAVVTDRAGSAPMPLITAKGGQAVNALTSGGGDLPLPKGLGGLPVVVELFTSQGCSSCPPADAMLANLVGQPNVLPLAYHVDYWDYLGWADSFARPEFTRRQEGYARSAGERAIYTPQMIVDGQDTALTLRPADLMTMIEAHRAQPAKLNVENRALADGGDVIELFPLSDLDTPAAILLVRYAPQRRVTIKAGENRGREMAYHNIVLDIVQIATWDGAAPLRLTVHPDGAADSRFPEDTRHAILVQQIPGGKQALPGPILAAMRLD